MHILFEFPYVITSSNIGLRAHWGLNHKRAQRMRKTIARCLDAFLEHKPAFVPGLRVTVRLQRIAPRHFDKFENYPFSMKAFVDEIARWVGLDDKDPRFDAQAVPQEKRGGENVVRVEIFDQAGGPAPELRVFTPEEIDLENELRPLPAPARRGGAEKTASAPVLCKTCGTEIIWGDDATMKDRKAGVCLGSCKPRPAVARPKPAHAALPWEQDPEAPDEWVTRDITSVAKLKDFSREIDVVDPDRRTRVLVRHDHRDPALGGDVYLYFEVSPPAPFVRRRDGSQVTRR